MDQIQKVSLKCVESREAPLSAKHLSLEIAENRLLRRQPEDHNFGSLLMLAVTAGAFLLAMDSDESSIVSPPVVSDC
jgi:hypothetical protein